MFFSSFCPVSRILCPAGSVLSGGGSVPEKKASPETWVDMVNDFQKGSLSTRLGIPMIYGIDAVHGHNNVYKATVFPHNVGLGATRQVDFMIRCKGKGNEIFALHNQFILFTIKS